MSIPDPKITIHGWRNAGPLVDVEEYQTGFGNRRQRWKKVVEHKPARGRDLQREAHAIVHRVDDPGYDVMAFNKGHAYIVRVVVDGKLDDPHDILVDATDTYASIKIADGVDVIDVAPFDSMDEAMKHVEADGVARAQKRADEDDEDAAAESTGNGSDEEE